MSDFKHIRDKWLLDDKVLIDTFNALASSPPLEVQTMLLLHRLEATSAALLELLCELELREQR